MRHPLRLSLVLYSVAVSVACSGDEIPVPITTGTPVTGGTSSSGTEPTGTTEGDSVVVPSGTSPGSDLGGAGASATGTSTTGADSSAVPTGTGSAPGAATTAEPADTGPSNGAGLGLGGDDAVTDGSATDLGATDPGTTDPGTTDPGGVTDPGTTDPGAGGGTTPGGGSMLGGGGTVGGDDASDDGALGAGGNGGMDDDSADDPLGGGAGGGGTGMPGGGDPGGGLVELDCNAVMPTSGAQNHSGNGVGGEGNLAWEIWSNTGRGELTTYDVPAFVAIWNEAGGYLGRLGFEWGGFGDSPQPYETHGTITAQYVSRKSGTAGQYSYVGMYGWSTDPCVEWYVVDDSYNQMPVNPGGTNNMGEVQIDDGTYIMYTRPTTGTGGTRCSGATQWMQYYSIRRTARQCGQISLTQHFDAWKSLGMNLGNLLEAKIIVEVGGGSGRVELPIANVTTSQ